MILLLILIYLPAARAQDLRENQSLYQERLYQENEIQVTSSRENPYQEHPNQENPYQQSPYQENPQQENQDQQNPDQENPYQEYPHQENPHQENQENPYQETPHHQNPYEENPHQENPYQENPYKENPYHNEDQENMDNEDPYQVNPHQENPDQENQYEENPYQENPHQENLYPENKDQENLDNENPYQVNPHQENPNQENPYQEYPHQENPYEENPHLENPYQEYPHQEKPRQENPHHENEDQDNPHQEYPHQENPHQENPYHKNHDHENPFNENPHHENEDRENPDNENPYQVNPQQGNPHQETPHQEYPHQENPSQVNPHQENPHQENPYQEYPHQENPHQENPYHKNQDNENPDQEYPHQENPHQEYPHQENPYHTNQDNENPDQEYPHQENPHQEYPHQENPYRTNQDNENPDQEYPHQENPYRTNQDNENPDQEYPHQENPYRTNQDNENPDQEYPHQENPDQEYPHHENPDQEYPHQENPYRTNQDNENPDQEYPHQENPDQEYPHQENPHQENPYRTNQDNENPDQEYPHQENPYRTNQDNENPDQEYPHQENPDQEYPHQEYPHQENPHQENPHQEYPHQENPHQENPYPSNEDNENPDQEYPHQENPYPSNENNENPDQEYPHQENPYPSNEDNENPDQEDPHQENPYPSNQDNENPDQEDPYHNNQDHENPSQCPGGSCNPQLGDLMVGRETQLSSSSTCGSDGPQKYCIIGYLQGEQKCFTCDSQLPYHHHSNPNSHRIQNIITTFDPDSKMKWWQSENGVHGVSIRLDLETMFQFSHLILTFRSFRPAAMLVERSQDFGQTWKVLRYFSEDCSLYFPSVSTGPADSVDDIVCDSRYSGPEPSTNGEGSLTDHQWSVDHTLRVTGVDNIVCDSRYSGPEPSTNGEVVLKALDPVFEIENPYAPNIQDLTLLTNLRVNFTRLFTLGDTLLSRRRRNPQNKYFYSLYNMVVQGRCFCHGHAQHCSPVGGRGDVFTPPRMVNGRCVCQHNTAGENCERCLPFHHDSPWKPGRERESVCRRCFCHGHSDSCHFDAERYQLTNGQSGGVCDDCRNRRSGPQCERCAPFFFQDPQRTSEDPQSCIPCDCERSGSLGSQCDAQTGRCICKENVEGQRCDRCKQGFYGLREDDPVGCQVCRCHTLGSVGCDQQTGACECERLAVGDFCDRCVVGFWGLGSSDRRCSVCDCDIGGAQCYTCSQEDGQCPCLPNMVGRRCSEPANGFFLPSLDYFLYEAELAAPLPEELSPTPIPTTPSPSSSLVNPGLLPQCEQYYRDQGYDFKISNGRVVLVRRTRRRTRQRRQRHERSSLPLFPGLALQMIPRQRSADQPVTWTGLGLVRVRDGAGLRFTVDNLSSSSEYQLVIAYELETPSDWLAAVSIVTLSPGNRGCPDLPEGTKTVLLPGKSRLGILGAPLCLNAGAQYYFDVVVHSQSGSEDSHLLIDSIGLILSVQSVHDVCTQDDVADSRSFRCVGLSVSDPQESVLEVCEGIIKSLSAKIHRGAVACRCSLIGSLSPTCSKVGGVCDCKANVIGHCCDRCAPLTFGFGPDGCTGCACDPYGSVSESCDPVSGQCACRPEVSEQRCDRCQRGLWGFPSCRRCECNGLSEECDQESGECVNCRDQTTGHSCERCEEGFHGYPLCRPCMCPELEGSSRFFATSCQYDRKSLSLTCNCLEGHTGPRCDLCSPGYYGNPMLDGVRCQECPCNNNVDPSDSSACDATTGECLRCLHNTAGPHCQSCKPGYYGNAVQQACKECTCDRRGTQVTSCPLDSLCFCNAQTGSCPCRTGATGDQCDQCEDGFWNLDGVSGCQPCSCDPTNAVSNVCDKLSGQCLCRPEYGGLQCDECGENHFGNPDLQCVSCDCNLEGTLRPSCNPETGECLCRPGVSGILCDECSPGRDLIFPECEECHPCRDLWSAQVTDILRAAERMTTLIPGTEQKPAKQRQQLLMLRIHSELETLQNISNLSEPGLNRVEKLFLKVRKMKDVIDPNIIIIDPSSLLNTDMENIQQEFTKILNQLKDNILTLPEEPDMEEGQELFEEIQNLHRTFMSEEQRLKDANRAVEVSMETRKDAQDKLNPKSSPTGDLAPLENKVQQLQVVPLNQKICGDPGLEDCSGCGGALCTLSSGQRKCGGPKCGGVLPLSSNISETAERMKEQLKKIPTRLMEYKNKVDKAKEVTMDAITQTNQLQERLSNNADDSEREKKQTKDLIQRVREYLMDDLVPPEDIHWMANAVLNLKLPRSREQISSMIEEIKHLLDNAARSQDDLKNLRERAKSSQELLKQALSLRDRTKDVDVTDINRNLYEAERAQDTANDALEASSSDRDAAKDGIKDVTDRLTDIEDRLNRRPGDLLEEIRTVKDKIEDNRQAATDAKDSAQAALDTATDAQGELAAVVRDFENLKKKREEETGQSEAEKRLKEMLREAEDLKRNVMEKLSSIQDVEQRLELTDEQMKQKAADVSALLKEAESLRQEISSRAETYTTCTA